MARNLYNEEYVTEYDEAVKIWKQLQDSPKFYLEPFFDESFCPTQEYKGYNMNFVGAKPKISNVAGAYLVGKTEEVWNKSPIDTILWLGATDRSIHTRVYRYFKEVFGKSRHDETHSGATKHRLYYGRKSVQNCFIKFVPYVKPSNLVLVEDGNKTKLTIERELIRLCYPKFNSR